MSFSAFNVGSQMMAFTSNINPKMRLGSRPNAGGSFTPNTLEAGFVMRSSLDYQFEKAFNDKYRAMMQNRLNDLQKKLQDAYTNLLNTAMGQQVGQEAAANLRSDVRLDGTDGTASAALLPSIMGANGFEDIGIVPKTASKGAENINEVGLQYNNPTQSGEIWRAPGLLKDELDSQGIYADDGASGYGRMIGTNPVQFRTLLDLTTAAGAVAGDLNVTFRTEADPPPPLQINSSLDLLNSVVSSILGGPPDPTYFNQKVVQSTTSYKTGGFWSAINYLYDFAPKQIKYTYAVGYTANTDETGNDQYLINGEPTRINDIPGVPGNNNYQDQDYLVTGDRLKWNSTDPTEGYQLEKSGTFQAGYGTVINRDAAWTYQTNNQTFWYDANNANTVASGTRQVVENLILQSGTYTYNGTFDNEFGVGAGVAGTQLAGGTVVQTSGTSQSGLVSLLQSNIELGSVFRNKVDMTVNGNNDLDNTPLGSTTDFQVLGRAATRSSLFYNHYEVETRTVDFNNSANTDLREFTSALTPNDFSDDGLGKVYVSGDIVRSKTVDASKNYDFVDANNNGVLDAGEITRTDGNVNNSFNGEFVQSLHKIISVNGQDIVGNQAKQASPIIGNFELGSYEGLLRAEQMSRNVVSYKAPTELDINASDSVPTDWYQAELLAPSGANPADPNNGTIWFPFVKDTLQSGAIATGYGRDSGPRQVIQTRNTFNLSTEEFMTLDPAASWIVDPTGVKRPTYTKKDFWVDIDLTGIHYNRFAVPAQEIPKLLINGRRISLDPGAPPPVAQSPLGPIVTPPALLLPAQPNYNAPASLTMRINLKDYLQEGDNIMVLETSDASSPPNPGAVSDFNEGVRVRAANSNAAGSSGGINTATVDDTINAKIITGYNYTPAVTYNPLFSRPNTLKVQSRWQSRVVPSSTEHDVNSKLVTMASSKADTGSAYKTSNSFIEMIINSINQQKYRDIFKLGLLSNLNKLAIQGSANLPNGASMQGAVTMYFDPAKQAVILIQDKLTSNS